MKITPLLKRVLILPDPAESKTSTGIIIPEKAQQTTDRGSVVAAAEGLTLKAGDRVLFTKNKGTRIKHDNQDVIMMKEDDILAII